MNEQLINDFSERELLENEIEFEEKQINEPVQTKEPKEGLSEALEVITTTLQGIRFDVNRMFFSVEELREIPSKTLTDISLPEQPVGREIIHHHHAEKTIWISAALFIATCLVSCALYITADKLDLYKANDTKYRYLKLESNKNLIKTTALVDSLFYVDAKMRDKVIEKEEVNRRNLEMLQRAMQLDKEAKELKQKAMQKKGLNFDKLYKFNM